MVQYIRYRKVFKYKYKIPTQLSYLNTYYLSVPTVKIPLLLSQDKNMEECCLQITLLVIHVRKPMQFGLPDLTSASVTRGQLEGVSAIYIAYSRVVACLGGRGWTVDVARNTI